MHMFTETFSNSLHDACLFHWANLLPICLTSSFSAQRELWAQVSSFLLPLSFSVEGL